MAGAGYKLFNTGDVLTAAQVNTYLNEQTVMVFASSAARTSALSGVLAEGMVSYLQDTNAVEVYNGTAWVGVSGAGDVTEVQAGTGISVASGTGPIPVVTNTMATAIDAEGDLIIGDAADAFQRLAIGSNTHVLTVDTSVDGKIKWAAPAGASALTLISTTTLSGSTTNIDSVFSSTYDNYLIQVSMDSNNTVGAMTMQLRASGSATATGYYYGLYQVDWAGAVALVGNGSNASSARIGTTFNAAPSPVTFTMFNPNRAQRTTFQGLSQGADTGASGSQMYWGGFQSATTQFDGFSIIGGSQTGKVRVYGYSN